MASDKFSIDCTLKAKSKAAILVETEDGDEIWIPHSQIDNDSELWEDSDIGEEGKLVVSAWLAEKKGLL